MSVVCKVGVLRDNGTIGELISGPEALEYWRSKETGRQ